MAFWGNLIRKRFELERVVWTLYEGAESYFTIFFKAILLLLLHLKSFRNYLMFQHIFRIIIKLMVSWFRNAFFVSSISSKKRTKTCLIVVKLNSFVRFLEETSSWKNHFDFVWPLMTSSWYETRKYLNFTLLFLFKDKNSSILLHISSKSSIQH